MSPEYFHQRLQDLEKQINEDSKLLTEFQEELRYEENPRTKGKYRREIQRQEESIAKYKRKYQEVQQEFILWQKSNTSSSFQVQKVESQFQQIDEKLNILIIKQDALANDLEKTRQKLLNRYSVTEQVLLGSIAEKLNRFQLTLTQELLYAIEANLISEQQMQDMLDGVTKNIPCLPLSQAEKIAKIIKDPAIENKHKLKFSLPIVPLLVDYETSIELGSGLNLKTVWEQLIAKLRRNPISSPETHRGKYIKLCELLKTGQWKEADLETSRLMLEVAGRQGQGWLRTQDIEKFPVADLRIIDNLWSKLSQNRFGFRVQREIWLSINPKLDGLFDGNLFPKLGESLGWRRNNQWLKYEQFCFTLETSEGHLPSFPIANAQHKSNFSLMKSNFQDLLYRVANC